MATENIQASAGAPSDYERVGGGPAIRAVVDRFYELVLADQQLSGFFTDSHLAQLKRHQVLLISQVMGGPAQYDGRELKEAHAGMEISSDDFGLVVSYLAQALEEAGVPHEVIARVGAQLSATKSDVVTAGTR